jgi:hypothetical protein
MTAGPAGEAVELRPGDVPHHYEALAAGTWAVLVMEHRSGCVKLCHHVFNVRLHQ